MFFIQDLIEFKILILKYLMNKFYKNSTTKYSKLSQLFQTCFLLHKTIMILETNYYKKYT